MALKQRPKQPNKQHSHLKWKKEEEEELVNNNKTQMNGKKIPFNNAHHNNAERY